MTTPLPSPDVTMQSRDEKGLLIFGYRTDQLLAYGAACAAAERAACIAICDFEASQNLEDCDLDKYYGTSAFAISNSIKARSKT